MKDALHETPPKDEEGGSRRLQEEKAKRTSSGLQNHLELRLGISLNSSPEDMVATTTSTSDGKGGGVCPCPEFPGWATRWFPESGNGLSFVHPWSLAARQQKAAFEKAHQKPHASTVPRFTPSPSPSVVGWPPVCAFRRSLGGVHMPKTVMDGEKEAKRAKTTEGEDGCKASEARATMFVKVNMEGYSIGRKIDLKAHNSYESLSRALQRMFNNFLSAKYCNNSNQDEEHDVLPSNYRLLYEDHDGDRMLVGDVPWEMFITSVKRLYITNSPRAKENADGRVVEDKN